MNIKKYKDKIIFSLFIIIVFILIFLLQKNVPMLGYDDYMINSSHGKGISSLFAVIENNILYWNGRSTQIIGCIIGFLPRWCFWIINTFAIILLIYLIYYYCFSQVKINSKNIKYKNMILTFLIVTIYIFYLFPATFDVFFWMPGACNHLWSVIMTLLFLIPHYNLLYNKDVFTNKNIFIVILYILSGIIVGSSLENLSSFVIIFVLYTFFISVYKNHKKLYKWQIFSSITYIIGIAYLYFLPSTTKRKIRFLNNTNIIQTGILKIKYILESFFVDNKILIGVLLFMLILYIIYNNYINKNNNEVMVFKNLFLLFLFSISTLFIFYFCPYYSFRALLLLSLMSLILVIYILSQLIKNKKIPFIVISIIFIFLDVFAYNYYFKVYSLSNKAIYIRNKSIEKQLISKPSQITYDMLPCSYRVGVIEYKESIFENEDNPNNYDNSGFKAFYDIGNNVKFLYNKNFEYSKYCINSYPIFDKIKYNGYGVLNKYDWIGANAKKQNN